VAAALTSAVFVSGAAAHRVKYDTAVSAKFNKAGKNPYTQPANFDGKVTSPKARCQRYRNVNLRLRAADGSSSVVASALTDGNGAWVIQPANIAPGTYYAQVPRKVLRKTTKHRHICRGAISKDVKVK
jgi:hypothetical protein